MCASIQWTDQPGSAPRVRGTLSCTEQSFLKRRFSPAGAGNAARSIRAVGRSAVQPRGCGERGTLRSEKHTVDGSAPRVRGTQIQRAPQRENRRSAPRVRGTRQYDAAWESAIRFSPAGAGNARSERMSAARVAVQPRGCGERAAYQRTVKARAGSAPRVRGTRMGRRPEAGAGRFSPAGAGNADHTLRYITTSPVQPRGCGERFLVDVVGARPVGSAPRVRGTLPKLPRIARAGRFSPAGAGNADYKVRHDLPQSVQPRGCGERTPHATDEERYHGSAPRVRGTLKKETAKRALARFSPAGAGNAAAPGRAAAERAVQPRGCGERVFGLSYAPYDAGSAPRVRGTRTREPPSTTRRRFSPAGAGNA